MDKLLIFLTLHYILIFRDIFRFSEKFWPLVYSGTICNILWGFFLDEMNKIIGRILCIFHCLVRYFHIFVKSFELQCILGSTVYRESFSSDLIFLRYIVLQNRNSGKNCTFFKFFIIIFGWIFFRIFVILLFVYL